MNSWHRLKKESSITDIEKQSGFQNDEGDSGKKMTNINPKWELILKCWSWMFVLVGVIVVLCVDPLFFYLPVINKNSQCIKLDDRLKIAATYLRLFFDMIFLANMIFRFLLHHKSNLDENRATPEFKKKCFRYLDLVIDILALLPIPQVLVPIIFKKMRSSKLLDTRKILKTIVLLQYVPRVVRIYLSWMKLIKSSKTLARRIWIKAAFNFFVYILTSHVIGALWYFIAIERQIECWHEACSKVGSACIPNSFKCSPGLQNNTFLDDFCRVQTTSSTTQFDLGIFRGALESGIMSSTNIPQKIMYCFWWGLKNLSSLGSNLETSNNIWENFFSIFILIFGLLLVLYFIGSVQTYIQMATEKATKNALMESKSQSRRQLKMHRWKPRSQRRLIDKIVNYMLVTSSSSDPLAISATDTQGNKAQNGSIKSPCTLSSHQPPKECNLFVMEKSHYSSCPDN